MLSAIGGTMGLLTGFSIISAVEIFYFAVKFLQSYLKFEIFRKKENREKKLSQSKLLKI